MLINIIGYILWQKQKMLIDPSSIKVQACWREQWLRGHPCAGPRPNRDLNASQLTQKPGTACTVGTVSSHFVITKYDNDLLK